MIAARLLLLTMTALLPFGAGTASAHASLASSVPATESTVGRPLEEVRLVFTEAVELGFSRFEVHELDASGVDMAADDVWRRLAGLAGELVSDVFEDRADDERRVDVGPTNDGRRSDEITVALRDDLAPGVYVAMWRVLSIDTHATQGFVVFEYAPEERP